MRRRQPISKTASCRDCKQPTELPFKVYCRNPLPPCKLCGGILVRSNTAEDSIAYPETESEWEIQAFIWDRLSRRGFDVRAEVTSRLGGSRLDLVVFVDREAVAIIETKKHANRNIPTRFKSQTKRKNRLQSHKYAEFNIPVHYVRGMV
jgi:hypothetical protein